MASITDFQAKGIVAGLASAPDAKPLPRYEIDDLMAKHPDTFNLFLLALERLQDENEGKKKNKWMSYFEQTIYATMQEIAAGFTDPKYRTAAQTFRLPYWDYFRARERKDTGLTGFRAGKQTSFPYGFGLPAVLRSKKLMVYRPKTNETTPVEMDNPLMTFNFPKTDGLTSTEWNRWQRFSHQHTVRHPVEPKREKDDFDDLDSVLNWGREPGLTYMLNMMRFPAYAKYENFARASVLGMMKDPTSGSLENLHDFYHGVIGGEGHMSVPELAAFDPVFWLHHCNVDRILAVWQATHDEYVSATGQLNASTPLYPFRKPNPKGDAGFWDSGSIRKTETLGYTYPDLQGSTDRKTILESFYDKYDWSTQRQKGTKGTGIPTGMEPVDLESVPVFINNPSFSPAPSLAVKNIQPMRMEMEQQVSGGNGGHTERMSDPKHIPSFPRGDDILKNEPQGTRLELQWFIDSEVLKDALNGTFTIYFFVGPVREIDTNPTKWKLDPILAGVNHVLTATEETCDNCAQQSADGMKVSGTSAITPILLDYVEYNLQAQDPEHVSGLKVTVSATISVLHPHAKIPEFKDHLFPDVTSNHHSGNPAGQ
ncbi:Polyphenol oxidase 4 [Lasiodiplodia theobromae]|uniref:tyrosinase n=1 Tax=Lasiodiplodia theobromae TaxID=45133 RepID=A0A5N5CUS6_9PEZI|nr:Polyphenol oxidase 4 [Lasiodiplodia theobromae]